MTIGTHENIINAFFRLAAKKEARSITLSEVAKEAHVSRQAIYQKHFSSIDEIIFEIRQTIYQDVYSVVENYNADHLSPNDFIAHHLLPRLYNYRNWIKILHTSNIDFNWYNFIEKQYLPLINSHVIDISKKLKLSKEFVSSFLAKYYTSIIASWLIQDLPMPPERFKKYFLQLTDLAITDLFD